MSSIIIKISLLNGTVRRRKFDTASVTLTQLQDIANLQDANAKLTWKDEENDVITIEIEADLQEAIRNAQAQQQSLRLIVVVESGSSEPVNATTAAAAVVAAPIMKSLLDWGRQRVLAAVHAAQAATVRSTTFQALLEDSHSIRAIFHARVERNRSIIRTVGFVTRAVLLWALFWPTFSILATILLGLLLLPRNTLNQRARKQTHVLLGLITIRVVLRLLGAICACVLPVALGLIGSGVLISMYKMHKRKQRQRRERRNRRNHNGRQHVSRQQRRQLNRELHNFNNRSVSGVSPEQMQAPDTQALDTLRNIFPTIDIQQLRQTYMRHGDVNRTVLELTGGL